MMERKKGKMRGELEKKVLVVKRSEESEKEGD